MKGKHVYRWLISLVVLLFLSTTACVSIGSLAGQTQEDTGSENLVPVAATIEDEVAVETTAPTVTISPQLPGPDTDAEGLQEALMRLYRTVNPSVVYIRVTSTGGGLPFSGSSGSGFVYSSDGTIVTNDHVVEAGSSYEIVFAGGERRRAELIGADPDADLAVLKVDSLPDGVTPLPLADMESVAVGQFVIAIGSPFGEQGSMSLGIISGLGRSLPSQRATATGTTYSLPQVIQTDAPINPGNSGGPLLNLAGEVIGVNAAIASASGTNSGVGFAIPVDVVKRVVPSLIEDGEVAYPYIGVTFDGEITLDDQETYGLSQIHGAYVLLVSPGSPAAGAGLVAANAETGRGGDLVIAIDDRPIRDFSDLNTYLVLEAEVGQTVQLTVVRGGETVTVPLTLGARP